MTLPAAGREALVFWLSIGAIWVGICWFYREYRIDRFRQDLFAIRDELFDLGVAGALAFDAPSYLLLRNTINGFLRFGHRVGFIWYVGAIINFEMAKAEGCSEQFSFSRRWQGAMHGLTPEMRTKLNDLIGRVHQELVVHLLLMSPFILVLLVVVAVPVLLWAVCQHAYKRLSWKLHMDVLRAVRTIQRNLFDRADSTALAVGGVH